MRILVTVLVLFPFVAFAQDKKSAKDELERDFAMACEISKVTQSLLKSGPFKENKPVLAYTISKMMEAALETPEAKNTFKALSVAALEDRNKLWHQSAKDVGLANWKCPTIGKF